jgi:hypothetical protein
MIHDTQPCATAASIGVVAGAGLETDEPSSADLEKFT